MKECLSLLNTFFLSFLGVVSSLLSCLFLFFFFYFSLLKFVSRRRLMANLFSFGFGSELIPSGTTMTTTTTTTPTTPARATFELPLRVIGFFFYSIKNQLAMMTANQRQKGVFHIYQMDTINI